MALDDVTVHAQAERACRLVASYVRGGGGPSFEVALGERGAFYAVEPHACGLDREFGLRDLVVLVGTRRDGGAPGRCRAFVQFPEPLRGYGRAIVVRCMRAHTEGEFRLAVGGGAGDDKDGSFARIFRHGFVHALDHGRAPGLRPRRGGLRGAGDGHGAAALGDAGEFIARYHDLAGGWLGLLARLRSGAEDAGVLADLHGFSGDFRRDLRNLLAAADADGRAFVEALPPRRRRALLRRLYKRHAEAARMLPPGHGDAWSGGIAPPEDEVLLMAITLPPAAEAAYAWYGGDAARAEAAGDHAAAALILRWGAGVRAKHRLTSGRAW
jgi:hypothetical protein